MQNQRKSLALCAACAGGFFLAQGVIMHATLAYAQRWGEAWALSALFALVYGVALAVFARLTRPTLRTLGGVAAAMAVLMLARVTMLDYVTADYVEFLTRWVDVFREGGFAALGGGNVGDYNLLYQYALLLIAQSPLHDLYLIKWVTVVFDFALALAMLCAADHFAGAHARIPVFLLVLGLPTVLIDGACWGQCDTVYVFAIVMCLLLLCRGKPSASAAFLALAFAFKLQTIFFFPVVLLGLINRAYKPRHALVFVAVYLLTLIPALIAGRSLGDALSVYANQSLGQYFDRLTYNAPNLYLFFPMLDFSNTQAFTWMRYIEGVEPHALSAYLHPDLMPALQNAALWGCIALTLLAVLYWLTHARELTMDDALCFALFFAIFLPFVMPKIHDRYFFLADMLSILYAAAHRERRFMPLLVIGASFACYIPYLTRQRPVDERVAALMMLAALVIVSRDLLGRMRARRAALKGGVAL